MRKAFSVVLAIIAAALTGCAVNQNWTPEKFDIADPFYTSKTAPP